MVAVVKGLNQASPKQMSLLFMLIKILSWYMGPRIGFSLFGLSLPDVRSDVCRFFLLLALCYSHWVVLHTLLLYNCL